MAETAKLVGGDSVSLSKIEFGEMGVQDIAISDSPMGGSDMPDSFIVDIENLANGVASDRMTSNSRISVKLQRNMSRKGSLRGEKGKNSGGAALGSSDGKPVATLTSGATNLDNSLTPAPVTTLAMKDPVSKQPQQTITITADNRCSGARKYPKQRPSFLDSRRIVLFTATVSSMGTMLLIYLTLAMNKFGGDSHADAH